MSVAAHEARHAAAAVLLGLDVTEAKAEPDGAGYVQLGLVGNDREREFGLMVLAGRLGDPGWPPPWPSKSANTGDERQLAECAEELGLDASGWADLCADARHLAGTPEFDRMASTLELLLGQGCVLDEQKLKQIQRATAREPGVRHKHVPAAAVALAEGEMVAVASTFGNVDLQGDRVVTGAFTRAVADIKAGARLPLIWGHNLHGSPQSFVGDIVDADETDEGLEIRARFDLEDPVGRKAYKLVKSGTIQKLSIGYKVRRERRTSRRINELLDVDLKEVSLVMAAANELTRVVAVKTNDPQVPTDAELRDRARRLGLPTPPTSGERQMAELEREHDAVYTEARDRMLTLLTDTKALQARPSAPGRGSLWQQLERRRARELRRAADRLQLTVALGYDPWER